MYMVVSYDIENDKRRGRIHRILKSFGQWMQYSVFECDLTRAPEVWTHFIKRRVAKASASMRVLRYAISRLCDYSSR